MSPWLANLRITVLAPLLTVKLINSSHGVYNKVSLLIDLPRYSYNNDYYAEHAYYGGYQLRTEGRREEAY
jgi:hypothetical protein